MLPKCTNFAQVLGAWVSAIPSSNLDVIIIYDGSDFPPECNLRQRDHVGYVGTPTAERCRLCSRQLARFMVLGEAHRKRQFRLVLCAGGRLESVNRVTEALELHVKTHRDGELHSMLSKSIIISAIPRIGYTG
jgi:hypothetical protein